MWSLHKKTNNSDVVARWGGEEFVVFLPNTDLKGAREIGIKINSVISEAYILPGGKKFTVSIGAAQASSDYENIIDVIGEADDALYWMKEEGGRNGTAYLSDNGFKQA